MGRPMKDSGVEWIGEIPDDWELFKVNNLFFISRGRVISKEELSDTGQYPVYSSQTKNNGVLGYINEFDYDTPQLTWTTDGANAGTVFLRDGKYNCTNVCGILKPKRNTFNLSFLKYSLEYTAIHHKRADTNGYKIMSNEMAQIMLAIPGIEQQEKITTLIDQKTTHIDSIIEKTKASIDAFKRYKQALITETVTKGLNPDVPMKDSGIEWIGMIPEHWDVAKLGQYFRQVKNKNTGMIEDNLLSLSYGNIVKKNINSNDGLLPESFEGYNVIKTDDIVLRMTDLQNDKNSLRTGYSKQNGIITSAYITIRKYNKIYSGFAHMYLHSFDISKGFYGMGSGVRQGVTFEMLKKLEIILPPMNEQSQIISYLDEKIAHIDRLIQNKQAMVEKLEAYKKSLIYEYVTGKKEVE